MMVTVEGRTYKNVDGFYEYVYVTKHSEDLGLLWKLHEVRLTQEQAKGLAEDLCQEFGLKPVKFRWTARTDRGRYFIRDRTIVIRPSYISAELLCHELAHHWVEVKLGQENCSWHGSDFVVRLDQLAVGAWEKLSDQEEVA